MKLWVKNFFYTAFLMTLTVTLSTLLLFSVLPRYYGATRYKMVGEELDKMAAICDGQELSFIEQQLLPKEKSLSLFTLYDESGKRIIPSYEVIISPNKISKESLELEKKVETEGIDILRPFNENLWARSTQIKDNNGNVYTLKLEKAFGAVHGGLMDLFFEMLPYVVLVFGILTITVALIYSKASTRRINKLSEVAHHMSNFDTTAKCDVRGNDELSTLGKDINFLNETMLTSIATLKTEVAKNEEIERNKAQFIQIASHELKTPITIMSGIVEGMLLNIGRYRDREKYLQKCQELLEQQKKLVLEIISVYRSNDEEKKEKEELIDLKNIIEEIVTPYKLLLSKEKKQLVIEVHSYEMIANKKDVQRILSNVIQNGFRYAKKEGRIIVKQTGYTVLVENECEVISKEIIDQLFEPYYRPDYSRNREDGGTGLGLFIVKQLMDKHKYSYQFEASTTCKGMAFTLFFDSKKSTT